MCLVAASHRCHCGNCAVSEIKGIARCPKRIATNCAPGSCMSFRATESSSSCGMHPVYAVYRLYDSCFRRSNCCLLASCAVVRHVKWPRSCTHCSGQRFRGWRYVGRPSQG